MKNDPELEIEFWKKETQKWKDLALRLLLKQSRPTSQYEPEVRDEPRPRI